MKTIPVLFELWDGKTYVGYVEQCYSRGRTWSAEADWCVHESGRFWTKRAALAALRKAWKARVRR